MFLVTTMEVATGILWVKAKDAAKHPSNAQDWLP